MVAGGAQRAAARAADWRIPGPSLARLAIVGLFNLLLYRDTKGVVTGSFPYARTGIVQVVVEMEMQASERRRGCSASAQQGLIDGDVRVRRSCCCASHDTESPQGSLVGMSRERFEGCSTFNTSHSAQPKRRRLLAARVWRLPGMRSVPGDKGLDLERQPTIYWQAPTGADTTDRGADGVALSILTRILHMPSCTSQCMILYQTQLSRRYPASGHSNCTTKR